MQQTIAFFDFDGTITTKDTLLEFIKFSKGKFRFYLGFFLTSPWLVALKLKLVPNQLAKEKVLTFFYRNCPEEQFQQYCSSFNAEALPALIRPKAVQEIARLKEIGASIVIVSASPENWIRAFALSQGAELLATRLAISNHRLTGKIDGRNCHGTEKEARIRQAYTLSEFTAIYAYGDSSGDKDLLALAHFPFYKPFR
ncbi:MAG TPA: HAD-IB family hydrolase [Puia sp.]|nr:HAD-IB family hydrolase [Puia sp.]